MADFVAEMRASGRLIDTDEGNVMLDGWFTPDELRALIPNEPKAPLPVAAVCEECGVAGRAPEGSVVTLWCNRVDCPGASSVNRRADAT